MKYGSKRLESVTEVMTSSKFVQCAFLCMETDGCLAINFKQQNIENCELTSGLSEGQELVTDVTSDVYVMGEYNGLFCSWRRNMARART